MFETQSEKYPVKLFQKYPSKPPVGMEKSGPFYLPPIVNPIRNFWYKNAHGDQQYQFYDERFDIKLNSSE